MVERVRVKNTYIYTFGSVSPSSKIIDCCITFKVGQRWYAEKLDNPLQNIYKLDRDNVVITVPEKYFNENFEVRPNKTKWE